ncbi:UNVERIFIED_CONTAM: hypothetical protein GTU68_020083 [Idotea baltica]|nr:hypothetical protein [Idotea baltica]
MLGVTVSNLSVAYGSHNVLKGLDFEAKPGEMTILIGPNGCGKSTFLKTLARVIAPSSGQVMLNDENVHLSPTAAIARKLAFLPQGPIAPEGLSVHELVSQGRFPHQSFLRQWSKEDEIAVSRALKMTRLDDCASLLVSHLSGGQRQRCWIAMILAQSTPIILLDEPATFLDLKIQVELMTLLKGIAHQDKKTILIVMHDLNIAAAFADHMAMMRAGEIVAKGSVNDVFTSEQLHTVFDLDARILIDPTSKRPICVPNICSAQ